MTNRRVATLCCIALGVALAAISLSNVLFMPPQAMAVSDLLQPAPTQASLYFDYFGSTLNPREAAQLVTNRGLNPRDPDSYARIGAVPVTPAFLQKGEEIFFDRSIGDPFGLQRVFGFKAGIDRVLPELALAVASLGRQPTNNLQFRLQKTLTLGSRTFRRGSLVNTGLDKVKNRPSVLGFDLTTGEITCAVCHVTLTHEGDQLPGVPNGDINAAFLIALATNSAAGFVRLNINPLDPAYQGNGKVILDSSNQPVELPDPIKFEQAVDDAILDVPQGQFESSPDGISNTTQIPNVFTFGVQPYTAGGEFAVGPFAGLSAINNGVHSSEINLLAAAQLSQATLGIDPEVYLGVLLQNAADPSLRLPAGNPVRPSQWLRQVAPVPEQSELEDQIPAPGTGDYPQLSPSLFTYNGLVFSPDTDDTDDIARGTFLEANNAMAAWQNSLSPPPNRTPLNAISLKSGSVQRGAQVFAKANCVSCHQAPYFTDNVIHPLAEVGTDPARAASRLALNDLLVPPKMYALNTPVPPPPGAEVIDIPTAGISPDPTTLPFGLLPDGGYKTPSLLGNYLSAPYLHDGGVAVREGALQFKLNGSFTVADPGGLGLPGTLAKGIPADARSSLHALVDRGLRAQVVAANKSSPALVRSNLSGIGHDFYVDNQAGFSDADQRDLVNFLLAIDDNPGEF